MPIQKNVPLSYKGEVSLIAEYREQDQGPRGVFPEDLIYNYGSGRCGDTNIGYISYYSGTYKPTQNEFTYYQDITFDIEGISRTADGEPDLGAYEYQER